VQRAVDAFVTRDAALAQEVEPMDDEVDALFSRAVTTVVDGLREGGESAYDAPGVLMAAKYFERMGDHAVIVADWAAFRAEGVIEQASGVCHGGVRGFVREVVPRRPLPAQTSMMAM